MVWPELPDKWTHKPIWLPPYPIPAGMFPNMTAYYTRKELDDEPPKKRYYFFDTPDYEDCHKKIYNYGLFGAKAAGILAMFDVMANKQLSYVKAFGRVATCFGRIGGSFLIYPAVVCCVANLRGKQHDTYEHPWNHIIGGASIGLIWGYKFRSTGIGAGVALAGALFGVLNLRANTPTPNFPEGWQIFFPNDIEQIRVENGVLGGQKWGDIRLGWSLADPGRKPLE
ncbi:unnamed protein product [Medioppia subpectinata]|uniref:NADH dehydrogenase [ubiquinone] 1 alpha subcomplex subunit 11 n=1 Tax=Medioppia subpectinata TaxID=1979941 RepID=A0A7R9PTD3_9ACAR|nr:unnamed protein product [Medioppia subpectinata]CAG2100379.1 unnamed protein product [Medioppia subpectinata]